VAPSPWGDVVLRPGLNSISFPPPKDRPKGSFSYRAKFVPTVFAARQFINHGHVRVNGKRASPKDRLQAGQAVRIPPLKLDRPEPRAPGGEAEAKTRDFLRSITLHEDADVLVLNKPMGLAVQGGSGTTRHIDGMLEVLRAPGPDGRIVLVDPRRTRLNTRPCPAGPRPRVLPPRARAASGAPRWRWRAWA